MDHLSLGGLVLVASEYIVHIVHFALSLVEVRKVECKYCTHAAMCTLCTVSGGCEDGKVQVLYTCGQYMGEVRRAVGEAHDFTTGRPITIMTPPLLILLFVFFYKLRICFSQQAPSSQLISQYSYLLNLSVLLLSEKRKLGWGSNVRDR